MRECGDCTECCRSLAVYIRDGDYKSPIGKYCKYVKKDSGCGVWDDDKSKHCKRFNCGWLLNEKVPAKYKPNKCGVVFKYEDQNRHYAQYWVNERDFKNSKKSMKELLKLTPARENVRKTKIIA